jgi:hypothetical protein
MGHDQEANIVNWEWKGGFKQLPGSESEWEEEEEEEEDEEKEVCGDWIPEEDWDGPKALQPEPIEATSESATTRTFWNSKNDERGLKEAANACCWAFLGSKNYALNSEDRHFI